MAHFTQRYGAVNDVIMHHLFILRSYSEPQYTMNVEGFRESPDIFQTYHGFRHMEDKVRNDSPPPGFIDEPSTPLPLDIGGKVSYNDNVFAFESYIATCPYHGN